MHFECLFSATIYIYIYKRPIQNGLIYWLGIVNKLRHLWFITLDRDICYTRKSTNQFCTVENDKKKKRQTKLIELVLVNSFLTTKMQVFQNHFELNMKYRMGHRFFFFHLWFITPINIIGSNNIYVCVYGIELRVFTRVELVQERKTETKKLN